MVLKEYRKKRNFEITSEPSGGKVMKSKHLSFVVQEHHASHLHYDFRLEWDGVLKSWAVPKGPSMNPADKRLAIEVEDHPIEYGKFEGRISKGQYGAGTVAIWDHGTWSPLGNFDKDYAKGSIKFSLQGEKLGGNWALVKLKSGRSKKNSWLLLKEREQKENQEKPLKAKSTVRKDLYPFELATLSNEIPKGKHWLYEIKIDGYRIHAYLNNGNVRLITRNGNDYTKKFSPIVEALSQLDVKEAVFDGEVAAVDGEGRTNFQKLQNSLEEKTNERITYYAFDLLSLNNHSLVNQPLVKRKELLKTVLDRLKSKQVIFHNHVVDKGEQLFRKACKSKLEGIIAKRGESEYLGSRTIDWLKIKCSYRQEFIIGGYSESTNARFPLGALFVGYYDNDEEFQYAGKVGTGFTMASRKELIGKLSKIETKQCPFPSRREIPRGTPITWVKPVLIAEVEFSEWTKDKRLRHPSFQGLREDKNPKSVEIEKPVSNIKSKRSTVKSEDTTEIGGVLFSHPDRPIYPDTDITKRRLAQFYIDHEKTILPYFVDRPLVLVRCPGGSKKCFFQRHAQEGMPTTIKRVKIKEDTGTNDYLVISSLKDILQLIQLNVIEFHAWGSKSKDLEHPDRIVFDLDPSPAVPWKEAVKAAQDLKTHLEKLNLTPMLKTTGGKGLHLVLQIKPTYSWDEISKFSEAVAITFRDTNPKKYTTTLSKVARKGKIFIDYLRNARGATSIIPYSLRAREGTPMAVPITWTELPTINGKQSLSEVEERLKKLKKDPWQKGRIQLPKNLIHSA